MKQIVLAASLALAAVPATAQEEERGRDLMEEGAKLLLRGLLNEASPAIRELQDLAQDVGPAMRMLREEMGPALAEIMANIDDIGNYLPPEILPNGDIVIRRAPTAPPYAPPVEDDVEL
ncbi:hypothetical protein EU805_11555 [Salipiger sp. IMCC34102]|uniref:hypothetical protein n=1 Tax=Salipiger sp. IMCC34102 TaxID=2510647 RepID=UPI00101BB095|nr:hypothetical protein [Salipiger sp. IMCC34102]RYH01824.1 hypothetical protein EU805_11555 [Salipiger sp. IMCC34102]